MGKKAQIKARVLAAFAKAGDVIYGGTLRRVRSTVGTYNPNTGLATTVTTTGTCKVLFVEKAKVMSAFGTQNIIKPASETMYLADCTLNPEIGDELTVDGKIMSLVFVDNILRADAIWLAVGD